VERLHYMKEKVLCASEPYFQLASLSYLSISKWFVNLALIITQSLDYPVWAL
jgi:hypothetical protein